MANEQQKSPQQQPQPRDRKRDIETLAADIYARQFAVSGGRFTGRSVAESAMKAAREFYAACDAPAEDDKPAPPG